LACLEAGYVTVYLQMVTQLSMKHAQHKVTSLRDFVQCC